MVFPCVLFIIVGLIYLGFYMHDKVKIQTVLNETALKGRALIRNEIDINTGRINYEEYNQRGIFYILNNDLSGKKTEIYNYLDSKLKSGLFIAKISNIEVVASLSNIHMEVNAIMEIPFFDVKKLFSNSGLSIYDKNITEIQDPMEFIRVFNVFSGVADKVEVVDKILKKLQKILNIIR